MWPGGGERSRLRGARPGGGGFQMVHQPRSSGGGPRGMTTLLARTRGAGAHAQRLQRVARRNDEHAGQGAGAEHNQRDGPRRHRLAVLLRLQRGADITGWAGGRAESLSPASSSGKHAHSLFKCQPATHAAPDRQQHERRACEQSAPVQPSKHSQRRMLHTPCPEHWFRSSHWFMGCTVPRQALQHCAGPTGTTWPSGLSLHSMGWESPA